MLEQCRERKVRYTAVRAPYLRWDTKRSDSVQRGWRSVLKSMTYRFCGEPQCRDFNGHLLRGLCADSGQAVQWIDALNEAAGEERFGFCMDVGVCNIDIERLWEELKNSTEKIYSDMVMELLADVDEQKLISKKRYFREQGINLTPDRRVKKEIFTLIGKISFERMVLRPADPESRNKLLSCFGVKSIAPLDICLGIDGFQCKMSIDMMLKCAFWAQNQCSLIISRQGIRSGTLFRSSESLLRTNGSPLGSACQQVILRF